ncbi:MULTISPECIES: hypothetical protein [Streptomyces]|uniref:hypothetical protein n=1 Tax=Streptomyces TaxID=1883 RepID=UPI0018ACBC40|nr:hypothetical protein [Streptomyces sp. BRB081]MBL3808544.1 hypothetical protein [Streptomyces sp. BRB081]
MSRRAILDHYSWADGHCFQHPQKGTLPTATLTTLRPVGGDPVEVRACEVCVVTLEEARARRAAQLNQEYEPGQLGLP